MAGFRRSRRARAPWHTFCFITLGGAPHAEHDDSGFSAHVRPRSQRRLTPSFVAALERARWLHLARFLLCAPLAAFRVAGPPALPAPPASAPAFAAALPGRLP